MNKKIIWIIILLFLFPNFSYTGEIQNRLENNIRNQSIEYLAIVYYRDNIEIFGDLYKGEKYQIEFCPSCILEKAKLLEANIVIFIHNHPIRICKAGKLDIETKNYVARLFEKENIIVKFFIITRYKKIEF